ncbi:MAG: FAD-linked oxidase C-terminal domain-containing protein [Pseudomonadota bacterium]
MSIETAIDALRKTLGPALDTSDAVRRLHGQNESYFPEAWPDGVATPRSTEEVAEIVRICAEEGCPIVPWGIGSSLEANALPLRGGLTLDMSALNQVLEIRAEDMIAVVQPGVTRSALNEALRATGLFFPVDPGADATLGGMAATRASGTTAVRYGTMRENVLALEVVLADGRVIRTGSQAPKSAAGYDLTKLIVGSEGTLGIMTELTLRLRGQPEAIAAAMAPFPSVDAAVSTVIQTMQMGVNVARIELLDRISVAALNSYFKADFPETPHLFLEFHGSESGVAEQAAMVGEIAEEMGAGTFRHATATEDRTALWKMRHNAFYAIKAMRPGCLAVTTDICVPISRLAQAIADTEADIAESRLNGPILGHVGDGNYHTTLLVEPRNADEIAEAKALAGRMAERALKLGGTVTGEHGIGAGKMSYMAAEHGAGWQLMAEIKRALDPKDILNPGKVVQLN